MKKKLIKISSKQISELHMIISNTIPYLNEGSKLLVNGLLMGYVFMNSNSVELISIKKENTELVMHIYHYVVQKNKNEKNYSFGGEFKFCLKDKIAKNLIKSNYFRKLERFFFLKELTLV